MTSSIHPMMPVLCVPFLLSAQRCLPLDEFSPEIPFILAGDVWYNASVVFTPVFTLSQSIDLPRVDDFLQELATIQQTGSKRIAILGSRHVPITHQNLIELMIYALVSDGNRILTSGSTGTNSAAIRGALRADPSLLTVILPQSLDRQPRESREQLEQVMHLVEHPDNNELSLGEASAICNQEIISRCQQLICFAFHDSRTLLQTCRDAEEQRKLVTMFYLD